MHDVSWYLLLFQYFNDILKFYFIKVFREVDKTYDASFLNSLDLSCYLFNNKNSIFMLICYSEIFCCSFDKSTCSLINIFIIWLTSSVWLCVYSFLVVLISIFKDYYAEYYTFFRSVGIVVIFIILKWNSFISPIRSPLPYLISSVGDYPNHWLSYPILLTYFLFASPQLSLNPFLNSVSEVNRYHYFKCRIPTFTLSWTLYMLYASNVLMLPYLK